MTTQKAPRGLGTAGKALWSSIAGPAKYDLRPDELRVLEDAAREADLIAEIDAARAGLPMLSTGSMGQEVIHPLISELRQHRSTLAALLRQLKLPEGDAEQKAGERSAQARAAVNTRWTTKRGA